MNAVLLSCRKAVYLIEKEQERSLTLMQKMQLKMHLSMCKNCANYEVQSKIISGLLKSKKISIDQISQLHLAEEVKTIIQKQIKENLPNT